MDLGLNRSDPFSCNHFDHSAFEVEYGSPSGGLAKSIVPVIGVLVKLSKTLQNNIPAINLSKETCIYSMDQRKIKRKNRGPIVNIYLGTTKCKPHVDNNMGDLTNKTSISGF